MESICKFTSFKTEAKNFCNNLLELSRLAINEEERNQNYFWPNYYKQLNDFNLNQLNKFRSNQQKPVFCAFCKKNGEAPFVYKNHSLRNPITGHVTCPILYAHQCELCGAKGPFAHTRSYCRLATAGRLIFGDNPKFAEFFNNICAIKKTKKNSAGKRRFSNV